VFRAKRRTVVTMAAVAAVLLAGALAVTLTEGSGQASGVTYVGGDNSQQVYAAGHRALAPDFTGTFAHRDNRSGWPATAARWSC